MKSTQKSHIDRRQFLRQGMASLAGAVALPTIVPASVFGKNGQVAPSHMITIGCIGVGSQGVSNMREFLSCDDVRVIAVCDVDANHLRDAKRMVDSRYGNEDCLAIHDFRDLIARDDIDAVSIATPDHWHAIPAITAAKSGKDIYSEKPLSHSFAEGRAMCDAVKRYNRIWQTGSWQRSVENFHHGCEMVINGRIGKVHRVEVGLPGGYSARGGSYSISSPPPSLDYDFWLGPAPYEPYVEARLHWNWRWNLDYGGGQLMDWVGHHVDIAHWGLGLDYTGPVEIEGYGEYPEDGPWDSASKYRITTKYKNGLEMVIAGGHRDIPMGTKWIGEDGWIYVNRGASDASPRSLLRETLGSNEKHLYKSRDHRRNFIDCVISRKTTITPCEIAHRSATPGHLGQIAMILGRKIRFNPDTETIVNDETATRMLQRSLRHPWHL